MDELVAVKTSDLTGAALDWAVAIAEFGKVYVYPDGGLCPPNGTISMNEDDGSLWTNVGEFHHGAGWAPSADWSQGGPLLEKYHISFHEYAEGKVSASINQYPWKGAWSRGDWKVGPTRLMAACRAIVASKMGHVVNVPRELLGEAVTVPAARAYTIWSEGYRATGESATATCHGTFQAPTFDEAVKQYLLILSQEDREHYHQHEDGTWTCWGCRLFDNEADARKSFG